jgi:hypothetical protein
MSNILELPTPRDIREAVDKLAYCQNTTTETIIKMTQALEQLAVWLKMQENINKQVRADLDLIAETIANNAMAGA